MGDYSSPASAHLDSIGQKLVALEVGFSLPFSGAGAIWEPLELADFRF
jgi:hypothetical protein